MENFYIFYGKESFLKEEGVDKLKEILNDKAFFIEYDVDNQFNIQELIANLSSDVLFNEINLIILKNADTIVTNLFNPLKDYYKSPNPNSILVMQVDKLDQRSKFAKFAKEVAQLVECGTLYDRPKPWLKLPPWESDLAKWVCLRSKKYQKQISPEASFLLTEYVGNDLKSLDSHLQKIALFLEKKKIIEPVDIEKLVYKSKKINVFDLLEAVCTKKLNSAVTLNRQIFRNGIEGQDGQTVHDATQIALQIIRLLHYQFKQIWKISIQKDTTGIGEYVKKKLIQYSPNFTQNELIVIWQKLLHVEHMMKSSRIEPSFIVEQTITEIIFRG